MLTSLCNFFCNKFFHKQEIGYHQNSNVRCAGSSGKRLKLIDRLWSVNGLLRRTSSNSLSMQKENADFSDDEEDCCIIAEIPRRKKPGNSVTKASTPEPRPVPEPTPKYDLFALRDSSEKDVEDVKYIGEIFGKEINAKLQPKRFFSTPRAAAIGKMGKSRLSYKSYLRRRMNYLQENYRLTEKYQYMQLLRSQTTLSFTNPRLFTRSVLSRDKQIEVIDLSDDKASDSDSGTTKTDKTDDQDVQIMAESSGVRSFQDILKIRPMTAEIALKEISSVHCNGDSDALTLANPPTNVDDDCGDLSQKTDVLEEKLRNFMQITGPLRVESESRESFYLPELTYEQERRIKNALIPEPSQEVLSEGFGLQITRRDMQTLFGLNWLNDEIINFYMNLIMERSKANRKLPKVYAFNTFFYPKLVSCGYSSLRRWTKQVDIFSYDLILVPIHLGMHWCLAVIDFRCSSVQYYDSVGSPNDLCLERLLFYLKAESIDKRNKPFQTSSWTRSNVEDIPQQMNGADCGVFSCMFAEFLARNCNISFTQDDMPYFRKKIVIEILQKTLLT